MQNRITRIRGHLDTETTTELKDLFAKHPSHSQPSGISEIEEEWNKAPPSIYSNSSSFRWNANLPPVREGVEIADSSTESGAHSPIAQQQNQASTRFNTNEYSTEREVENAIERLYRRDGRGWMGEQEHNSQTMGTMTSVLR